MSRLLKNVIPVILNQGKDQSRFEKSSFGATCPIPKMGLPEFFHSFRIAQLLTMLSILLPNGDIPCWTGMLMKF
jgi:hypothetical protein